MKKIKLLLRFGLACCSLTICGAAANAQSSDETSEALPPIVQVASEQDQNPVLAAPTSDESTVHEDATPVPFHADASPFRVQPLKPILEAVPIVKMASAGPEEALEEPQDYANAVYDQTVPPIVSSSSPSAPIIVHRNTQPGLPKLQTQSSVPPGPRVPQVSGSIPAISTSVPNIGNNAPMQPFWSEFGAPNATPTATAPMTGLQPNPSIAPTLPSLSTPSFAGTEFGGSGYDHRGRCAHCGGLGCPHCSGGGTMMSEDTSPAPVMPAEYSVVESTEDYQINPAYDCCGFMTSISDHYFLVDFLYWQRADDTVFGGNFARFDDFDWTRGGRATLGKRWDCAGGCELSFTGFDPWIAVTGERDATGRLQGNLVAASGFSSSSLSAFRNATFLEQLQKTKLFSGEINRTYWGWDVVKNTIGVRYIYFDDEYRLSSANVLGQQGWYFLDNTNYLFGPQMGSELFYDVGYRLSFSFAAKIGGYFNVNRGRTAILNNGSVPLNASDKDTDFSASAEVGFHGHYQLLPRVRARFGYDVLGLWGVATNADNFTRVITPTTGRNYEHDDDAFFHGVFGGIEIYR